MTVTASPQPSEPVSEPVLDGHQVAMARLAALRRARFELIPLPGVDDQVEHLPPDATATITASPTRGLEATLALGEQIAATGRRVVPHLAARLLVDRAHVAEVLARLDDAGITDLFVPAGDAATPAGAYDGAVDLLREVRGLGFAGGIGITGYPESHHLIDDATTIRAMSDKAPHADHVVSQICYDPTTIAAWVRAVRARGVTLPIQIGLPGVVPLHRLAKISMRVGLGESVRFLAGQHGVAGRLLTGFDPGRLVDGLAETVADPASAITGWHLFTFNAVEATVAWWERALGAATAHLDRLAAEATTRDAG